ncbi:MAG: aminotransferase class IV [Bacteroidota bacterium]
MSRVIEYLNGNRIHPGSTILNGENRSFLFGDGLFETIRIYNGKPLFLASHIERMMFGMDRMFLEHPLESFEKHMQDFISMTIQSEKIINGRARLTVYRDASGFYTPSDLNSSWHLIIRESEAKQLSEVADCKVVLFPSMRKDNSMVSRFKTTSSLIYVMAGIHAASSGADECIIMNHENRLVESHTSNLFLKNGKEYYTPPVTEGCIDGVMRRHLIGIMNRNDIPVREIPLTKADLLTADEVLLTNAMNWVKPVTEFENQKYSLESASKLNQLVLEHLAS